MNFKESRPIYLQIADRIMDEIMQHAYSEGGRIPSVREYAATVEVNANTVVRSFDWLQQQEIIFNRRGIGYFVSEGACGTISRLRRREFEEEELPEMFRKMQMLGITADDIDRLYKQFIALENNQFIIHTMNKMFLAALLAISGGSIATADTLLGHVADSEGNPVEFATVVALSANHEQGGAVTDSIGNYRIDLPKGQYNVTFTLVGYDNAEKAVTVSGETRLDATMATNAVALHGVEVKASAIRRLPDRFVVRVEDMPAAIGKDGKELLQAAPGVWIDDKKITINGKSGAKVMVNDRELRMDQSQLLTYLRSLKAEDVSKI